MDSHTSHSAAHQHEQFYPPEEPALEEPESKPMAGILLGSVLGILCWTLLFSLLVFF